MKRDQPHQKCAIDENVFDNYKFHFNNHKFILTLFVDIYSFHA
jgi:hypothetical protein